MKLTTVRLLTVVLLTAAGAVKTQAQEEVYAWEERATTVQMRTNGLYWLALSPNVGIELQTDKGWAFQLDYVGAWWNSRKTNHFYSNYGFQAEVRYYLDSCRQVRPYTRHHVGLYAQMLTYDFEFGGKGYQCPNLRNTYAIGASYGYTMPLNDKLSLDFTIGIGYFSTTYNEYVPINGDYLLTGKKRKTFFGPTKAEVTLVWNVNDFNYTKRKTK